MQYSIESITRKCVKGYGFLSFMRNFSSKYRKKVQDTGLAALKTASKKTVQKAAEATDEFIGNKTLDKIAKQKPVIDENSKNLEEIVIPPEKREEILNELRQVLKKWNIINNLSY